MSEVRYSVNGKYFKDFGIYISDSDGLFDGLKRKKIETYDWAEYNGSAPDLSNPKFEAREITLKGFVVGINWEQMKSNFDAIVGDFQKAGTQRLLIEPLGLKTLPYEVYCDDATPLNKTFRQGKMVGTFTLKLIEPNPIKKVLYFTGNTLNLSYTSPNETEIFYGNGLKDVVKGNASISGKVLANRVVSGYNFGGRNLLKDSNKPSKWLDKGLLPEITFRNTDGDNKLTPYGSEGVYTEGGIIGDRYTENSPYVELKPNTEYVFSFDFNWVGVVESSSYFFIINNNNEYESINLISFDSEKNKFARKIVKFKTTNNSKHFTFRLGRKHDGSNYWLIYSNFKLEEGNKGTDWTPAPEDEKFIIIAGNIEEITDLTTNADKVLWERL